MRTLKKRGSVLALMRSKIKFSLLLSLILCLMMVSLASADLGTPVYSSWAYIIPTNDGTISVGEWTDATVRDFTLQMRKTDGSLNQTLSARLYVKNDYTNIYAAVQIFNDDYDAQNWVGLHYDSFALFFEDDHDHSVETGDDGAGLDLWNGSVSYTNNDLYFDGAVWNLDIIPGKNNDGAFNWSHTNPWEELLGTYTFEMRIPFVGSDGDAYDLAITTLPATVGFKIWFRERDEDIYGVYPDDPGVGDNRLEITDGTKFGNLVFLRKPAPPPVGGTAAPIVIPINKPASLTPLIWLASTMIIPIAVTLVFVKLKKKKQ